MDAQKKTLVGFSMDELVQEMTAIGEKPFRAKQLWHWIYNRGETDFAKMSSLARPMQQKLAEHYDLSRPTVALEQTSVDGARKWLLGFRDGNEVEAVYIPEEDRGAVCVSSQVGCMLDCRFCHTGTQGFVRNLTAAEIVEQFMIARDSYGEWPSPSDGGRLLSNIVLMGMGEPLLNLDNVVKALSILTDGGGIAVSKRRITLSTAGVVPGIRKLGEKQSVNLAISLHAVTDEVRDRIMPINKKYPLRELFAALRDYPASNARRITLEYLLLKDVNDSLADARQLIRLVKDLPVKFNLIAFNPWPGSPFEAPSARSVDKFSEFLFDSGYSAPVRQPRGQDILAACGQLKSDSERKKRAACENGCDAC